MAKLLLAGPTAGLSGSAGRLSYVRTPYGTSMRERTFPRDVRSPLQRAQRWRVERAADAWRNLDPEATARWREYARLLDPNTGAVRTAPAPRADNLFNRHYRKLLMIDRAARPPLYPPEGPFYGDVLALRVDAPSPGSVRFVADRPSTAGVLVECLVQPLLSPQRRTYLERYRHAAFWSFPADDLELEIEHAPGTVALGFRFVRAGTGQATPTAELGVVRVG